MLCQILLKIAKYILLTLLGGNPRRKFGMTFAKNGHAGVPEIRRNGS
jgi:hypothetical protein